MASSSLLRDFLHWYNYGQYLQVTLPLHTSVVFHRQGNELPNPMGTYYSDACQVVETQLATEIFFHELINMIVVPAPPDGCGIFVDFYFAIY